MPLSLPASQETRRVVIPNPRISGSMVSTTLPFLVPWCCFRGKCDGLDKSVGVAGSKCFSTFDDAYAPRERPGWGSTSVAK